MAKWREGGFREILWFFLPVLAALFLWALPAQAADNSECLKCHQNPRLSKGKKDGSLLSLHVNEEAFKKSVHGAAGMGCTDCHQEAKANVHPAQGFQEVGCAGCHQDSAEAYKKTSHGMMRESGMDQAPRCADCHTAHYVRKIADPESPVRASRLPKACAQCHEAARPTGGFFTALATYRIMGHPKTDLGKRYDTRECVNCHPQNTGHPQKETAGPSCVKCHDPSLSTPMVLGPMHVKMTFKDQPVAFLLRILYGLGIAGVVVGCAAFFGYRTYKKKKPAPREGEGDQSGSGDAGTGTGA
ncbi:MAG TPA: cytochrome c3 family protein [Thermodesulfobacteriota bacterium]|nr:cytochrome c3 family protein [Thermodesulfobacteriota bacterium]